MPLQSDFELFLNQCQVRSSKEDGPLVTEFAVTELPTNRIESANKQVHNQWRISGDSLVSDSFPDGVRGSAMVGARSLHSGKSADLGRSHGFFVKVRGRLINEEDPLFGLSPLSYQTFNRFRADITVDDLDTVVTAPREGIEDSPPETRFAATARRAILRGEGQIRGSPQGAGRYSKEKARRGAYVRTHSTGRRADC